MRRTDVIIIGAGQAGLAMSACLAARGIDHALLERGRVAERWRCGSWDSLRLLTPNWLSRLPGWSYTGAEPDGFMRAREFVAYLEAYAASFDAPVVTDTVVHAVERFGTSYRVATSKDTWSATAVVIATGQCQSPHVPAMAQRLSPAIRQMAAADYKRPEALPAGAVLVVGASASGIQIAEEINRAGRPVTLAVGRHTRLPRRYRGRDIMWWLDRCGILDDAAGGAYGFDRTRSQPSLQLSTRPEKSLDLSSLRAAGVRIVGRAVEARGTVIEFAGDLADTTAAADRRLARLLERIDRVAEERGLTASKSRPLAPVALDGPPTQSDLGASGIATVIWASGYQPRYSWLHVPVLGTHGDIEHIGGVTSSPGLFVLGLRWLRRRSSSFIDGTGRDAGELAMDVADFLNFRRRKAC